jgi:small ligand-binding sensory domain FIST
MDVADEEQTTRLIPGADESRPAQPGIAARFETSAASGDTGIRVVVGVDDALGVIEPGKLEATGAALQHHWVAATTDQRSSARIATSSTQRAELLIDWG